MFEFFSPKKKALVAVLVLVALAGALTFGIFSFAKPAEAGRGGTIAKAIGWVGGIALAGYGAMEISESVADALASFDIMVVAMLTGLVKWLGIVFSWVVGFLVEVAAYNSFLDATAVVTGWVIVRDVANMFFVLILLVISIATILRVEAYSYKKLLPKLLLMAVLINFSKTICGIIIDFAQVIMLTFVNAFQAAAGANFFQALGLDKLFSFENLAQGVTAEGQQWDLVGTALLALIVTLVATITVGVLMVVLVARIVVLWTLIVLSPLAYLLASFPQGQSYAKQWWDEFTKYVISGPILAFFIWLALIVAGGGNANTEVGVDFTGAAIPSAMGDIADPNLLSSLVVGVTMLLVGLMFTQKLGIIGSGVAGAALSGLRSAGTKPFRMAWSGAKGGVGLAWKGTKAISKGGYQRGADIMYGATGVALPGSKMRSELKDERKKTLHRDRLYRGQVASADKIAGKRSGVSMAFAALMDPGLARKMGTLDMVKMLGQRGTSDAAIQRDSELRRQRARYDLLKEDPVGRFEKDTSSELKTQSDLAKAADDAVRKHSKEAKELDKEMSDGQKAGVDRVLQLNAQRVNLEGEIAGYDSEIKKRSGEETAAGEEASSLAERIAELQSSIAGTGEGTPERQTLEVELGRVEVRHGEATQKRDQATQSRKEKERLKTEREVSLTGVKQELGGIKVDVRMEKSLDIHAKIEAAKKKSAEHQGKADKLNDLTKRWATMGEKEKTDEVRSRLNDLYKRQTITNSALSTLTPELKATMDRSREKIKDLLTKRLGKEPTEEEVGREMSEALERGV